MFTINKKDAEVIAKQATESFEDCLTKFDSLKYPDEPYLEWKKVFTNPQDVTSDHIKLAMEWKYGHWGKASYVPAHKVIIAKVQNIGPNTQRWEIMIWILLLISLKTSLQAIKTSLLFPSYFI